MLACLVCLLLTQETEQQPPAEPRQLTDQAQDLITRLVLLCVPHRYEDDDKWDRTTKVQSGLRVRFEGGKLRTNRRWKSVKHGRWQKYTIRLVEPDERFAVRVNNMVHPPNAPMEFDITCTARLVAVGRWQEWQYGVSLFRLSAEVVADVTVDAHCLVDVELGEGFPPDVQLNPSVETIDLRLSRVRLKRVSHLKGTLAEELGRSLKSVLKDQIERRRRDLKKRINKELADERDRLRVSPSEWFEFIKSDRTAAEPPKAP